MSNCSPYRKIYNSSRCGKHYVLSHSRPPIPIGPILSPSFTDWPPCSSSKHMVPEVLHPYRTRGTRSSIRWSNVSRDCVYRGFPQDLFCLTRNYFRGCEAVGIHFCRVGSAMLHFFSRESILIGSLLVTHVLSIPLFNLSNLT